MGYDGWVEFGDRELFNISRTAQLAESLGIDTVWTEPESVQWIQDALAGEDYGFVSAAPWYDDGHPPSAEFAGLLPLSLTGLDDSTMESTPVEYVTDGGNPGRTRNTTLPLVANVAIVASTNRGADFGKRWLDRVLRGSLAKTDTCSGLDLRYFQFVQGEGDGAPPQVHRRNVKATRGTSVTRKHRTDCSVTWFVTFTLTAADPYEYGEPEPVLDGLGGVFPTSRKNLITNPSFEVDTANWVSSPGNVPSRGGGTGVHNASRTGNFFLRLTTAESGPGGHVADTSAASVVAGTDYTFSIYARASVGIYPSLLWRDSDGAIISSSPGTATIPGWHADPAPWPRLSVTGTAPARAASVDVMVWFAPGVTSGVSIDIDGAMLHEGPLSTNPVSDYGVEAMTEQQCPVYNYDPIYDPLNPALIEAPTAPDLLPTGWGIEEGMTFNRYWAVVPSPEPNALSVVPRITLTTEEAARFVRVSIWDAETDSRFDQCGALFSAVVSYLPPGVEFVIDGEQEAVYTWDGFSPAVRRADSLVYDPDARPVQWESLNGPQEFLVTMDLFTEGAVEQGGGEVRMALDLIPKSD